MLNVIDLIAASDAGAGPAPTLAEGLLLVSFYKPLLMLIPFLIWAWVVSSVYDKDAGKYYLKRREWNILHLLMATVAVGLVLALPMGPASFWIAWPAMIVILVADLLIYFFMRNADDRIPDAFKWSLNPAAWLEAIKAQRKSKETGGKPAAGKKKHVARGEASLVFRGPKGTIDPPPAESPEMEVRLAAEGIFQQAIDVRASQIDILPSRDGAYVTVLTVDGVQQTLDPMTPQLGAAVIDLFKAAAGLDVGDRRRRQRGTTGIGHSGSGLIEVGVTSKGGSSGMRLTMRIDPVGQITRDFDELGLLPNQAADLNSLMEARGVVLQTAPPDQGRTTTFYALVRKHDAYTSNVQTLEIEPEGMIEGVRHNAFDPAEGAEFATTVRSILRRDPDVLGIAEFPDADTAREVMRADHDRTRVYLSYRADNAIDAIRRYVSEVGDAEEASRSLAGVVSQKLVRRLCHNCRVPFEPTPDILTKLGLPTDTRQLYRKSGSVLVKDKEAVCPVCNGTGYFGQVGVFAVHTIGPEERELIVTGDVKGLRGLFRQKKQQSIQTAGLQHVLAGHTSVDELLRVISPPAGTEQKSKPERQSAPAEQG